MARLTRSWSQIVSVFVWWPGWQGADQNVSLLQCLCGGQADKDLIKNCECVCVVARLTRTWSKCITVSVFVWWPGWQGPDQKLSVCLCGGQADKDLIKNCQCVCLVARLTRSWSTSWTMPTFVTSHMVWLSWLELGTILFSLSFCLL